MRGATSKKKQIPHPVQKKNVVRNDTCWSVGVWRITQEGGASPAPTK
jgi:hypothetical protein